MHNRTRKALPAAVFMLAGLNIMLGAAVASENRSTRMAFGGCHHRVIYNGSCPACQFSSPGETIELDSNKAEYACCDRAGFCAVCSDCSTWNPFC